MAEGSADAARQLLTNAPLTLTLPDGRTLRVCLACGVGEHESCVLDAAVCDGCAVCRSVRPDYPTMPEVGHG